MDVMSSSRRTTKGEETIETSDLCVEIWEGGDEGGIPLEVDVLYRFWCNGSGRRG